MKERLSKLKELAKLHGPKIGVAAASLIICWLLVEGVALELPVLKAPLGILAGWKCLPKVWKKLSGRFLKK